ncbi:periostin-like [Mercenaria mercenaria]|uniref:periostin-like n=1 Tax=Mercenaria mercenaria TaxID=6596 RepID=UPI00234ED4BC|nr:periostin-like [Mercenaria mercenaria]
MKFALVIFVLYAADCLAQSKNIVELAEELGATTLVSYVKAAGLESALKGNGPFTVFGPTNAAFEALPAAVKDKLTKDKDLLKKVLEFHVASGKAYSSQLSNNMMVQSLDSTLSIRVNIYQKESKQVVTVDGAEVVMVDQNATNGVIHVIDKVMFPLPSEDIPKTVAATPNLSTLLYAVAQGQLAGPLAGSGPFTLFAPNNAAFDKLPPGALSDLLSNQTALVAVLKYHVVVACDYSAGLSSGSVQTLEGKSVTIAVTADGVTVDNAKVVTADIPTSNGVIHEIDTVLLPPK